jgi:hypothetical protein
MDWAKDWVISFTIKSGHPGWQPSLAVADGDVRRHVAPEEAGHLLRSLHRLKIVWQQKRVFFRARAKSTQGVNYFE